MILLKELLNKDYVIFCDMDGVLCNFEKMFFDIADVKTETPWDYEKKFGEDKFWNVINSYGIKFWTKLPWMPDGKKLWSYLVKNYKNVNILSAPSSHDQGQSVKGKKIWLKSNIGSPNTILDKQKYKYAKPNHILIDDLEKNIKAWTSAGGIGILHKSASDTISKLKTIGI